MTQAVDSSPRVYRYYDFIMAAFVTSLLCSNLIGVAKVCQVGGVTFGAAVFFFPISYFFGDILTEVYGYAKTRRVVWAGFAAMAFASVMSWIVVKIPPAPHYAHQAALEAIFSGTPRIMAASLIAYFAGEFCNSLILAKLKVFTNGRHLWMRTIGSTMGGEFVDSIVFYPLAFYGIWSSDSLLHVIAVNFLLKVSWEVVMTPVTYKLVNFLKRVEKEDFYDRTTNFTPFSLDP